MYLFSLDISFHGSGGLVASQIELLGLYFALDLPSPPSNYRGHINARLMEPAVDIFTSALYFSAVITMNSDHSQPLSFACCNIHCRMLGGVTAYIITVACTKIECHFDVSWETLCSWCIIIENNRKLTGSGSNL